MEEDIIEEKAIDKLEALIKSITLELQKLESKNAAKIHEKPDAGVEETEDLLLVISDELSVDCSGGDEGGERESIMEEGGKIEVKEEDHDHGAKEKKSRK